jgi:hypothetical protein
MIAISEAPDSVVEPIPFARPEDATGMLAAAFGVALLAAAAEAEGEARIDRQTARELAVLARILERRLGETRHSLATSLSAPLPERVGTATYSHSQEA